MATVGELVDVYVAERIALNAVGELTARNDRCALRLLARVAGPERHVAAGQIGDVKEWLKAQHDLAPATRRCRVSKLRGFIAWLIDEGHLDTSPAAGLLKSVRQPRSVSRALSHEDIRRLFAALPDARAEAIVWLMYGNGLRCCEVANLELGDWDRDAETILVNGKGGHQRVLTVPDECGDALRRYLAGAPTTAGPIVRSYRTGLDLSADTISGLVSDWMRAAEIKRSNRDGVSAHALRHTAASELLEACNDLRVVQEFLGHEHLQTTAIYLRRAGLSRMRTAMSARSHALVEMFGAAAA